jgi:hypothetical protein
MDLTKILEIAAVVYGVLALIVKACPTIPNKFPWSILLFVIKILGKLTNNQTDDEALRAKMK